MRNNARKGTDRTMRLAKTTLMVILLLSSRDATAAEPAEQPPKSFDEEVRSVDLAIKYYMRSEPGKVMSKDPEVRIDMAKAIVEASQTHGIPPLLLTTIVYNESTFEMTALGKLGEVGLTQVHGIAARNCDLTTVPGQLECGAKWLAHYYPICKSWEKSLTAYATRGFCVSTSEITRSKIAYRMRQWKKIEKEVETLSNTDYGG
jgi:hypothetical protein